MVALGLKSKLKLDEAGELMGDSVGEQINEGVGGKYKTRSTSAIPLMAVPFSNDPLFINSVYCVMKRERRREGTN